MIDIVKSLGDQKDFDNHEGIKKKIKYLEVKIKCNESSKILKQLKNLKTFLNQKVS